MATRQHGHIVENPTEARQAEPGPSVLALLMVSTGLAVLILGLVWFVFFHTGAGGGVDASHGGEGRPFGLMAGMDWNRTLAHHAGNPAAE